MQVEPMRRAWMEVDSRALRANYAAVTQRIPAGCGTLPMVKADAYGTGAALAVRTLAPLGPAGFGVATLAEGLGVREAGWDGRVVVFTPTLPADLDALIENRMEPAVGGLETLNACGAAARATDAMGAADDAAGTSARLAVHLEVDTGMGRFGLPWTSAERWAGELAEILARGGLTLASTFTHFHSAGTDEAATREQWRRFEAATAVMGVAGVDPGRRHAANSAAILEYSGVASDLVRPGVWLYGVEVAGRRAEVVASVRARVLEVRDVPPGSTVSYGATWTAPAPARLATLGIGYADGLRRCLSGRGSALIHGREAPIRGVITMDSTVVDVTGRDDVHPGDVATVLGRDGQGEIAVDDMAGMCGTIAYEILTGWSARIPRIGIDGDL